MARSLEYLQVGNGHPLQVGFSKGDLIRRQKFIRIQPYASNAVQIVYSYLGLFFLRRHFRSIFSAISQKRDHLLKSKFPILVIMYKCIYIGLTQSNGSKNQRYILCLWAQHFFIVSKFVFVFFPVSSRRPTGGLERQLSIVSAPKDDLSGLSRLKRQMTVNIMSDLHCTILSKMLFP